MKLDPKNHLKYQTWLVGIILGLGLIWIFVNRVTENFTPSRLTSHPYEGFLAPDFELSSNMGKVIKLSDLRGQPVIINFWASWCPPCRIEMSAIEAAHLAYQDEGLLVLGINAADQDSLDKAQELIAAMGLTFQVLYDTSGKIQDLYDISALPTTFFIDREGIIREVVIGGPMAEALLDIRAEEIIEDQP